MKQRILVKTPNWLGDSIMSLPAVNRIRQLFPEEELWVLTRPNLAGLWKIIHEIDKVIIDNSPPALFKPEKINLGILLTNSFASALYMFRMGASQRRGYSINFRQWLLTQPVRLSNNWRKLHQIEYFLGIINGLGSIDVPHIPHLNLIPGIQNNAKAFLARYGWMDGEPIIGIHATASYGPAKCWLKENYAELIQRLNTVYKTWVFLCGSGNERDEIDDILKMIQDKRRVFNIAGETDIAGLAGFISLCGLFIANDSGPMHLASALGVPVVAVFGPTDPELTGPKESNVVVLKKDLPCSPCFKRRCPNNMECMRLIKVEDVMQAVERQKQKARNRTRTD